MLGTGGRSDRSMTCKGLAQRHGAPVSLQCGPLGMLTLHSACAVAMSSVP